jgi:hypothetical protein
MPMERTTGGEQGTKMDLGAGEAMNSGA